VIEGNQYPIFFYRLDQLTKFFNKNKSKMIMES